MKKFLALAQRFGLPLFLADTAALTLLSHDALRQRDRLVREPHCSFLCTGRPITSFALHANLWKYEVSVCSHQGGAVATTSCSGLGGENIYIYIYHPPLHIFFFSAFVRQPGFLLAAEQKGFELLELRGEDPRLASLDTLSGQEIPLHFLFRLHGYIIHVSGAMATTNSIRCRNFIYNAET